MSECHCPTEDNNTCCNWEDNGCCHYTCAGACVDTKKPDPPSGEPG